MKDVFKLGTEIDRLRGAAGLSQRALAERAEINQSSVSAIICRGVIPTEKTLRKLAAVLPLDLEGWVPAVEEYRRRYIKAAHDKGLEVRRQRIASGRREETAVPVIKRQAAGENQARIIELCRAARAAGMSYGEYVVWLNGQKEKA